MVELYAPRARSTGLDRDARPRRRACAERRVGRVYFGGDGVAAGEFADHIGGLPAGGCDQVVGKRREPDFVFVHQHFERLGVETLHLGERVVCFRSASMRDDGLEVVGERVPDFQRDDAFAGAVRLVEAGIIVKRRDAIEAERDVGARADEFGAVDHAGLQAHQDFRGRRGLRRGAEPAVDFAAEPECAQFERRAGRRGFSFRGETSRPCRRRCCRP